VSTELPAGEITLSSKASVLFKSKLVLTQDCQADILGTAAT